MSAEAAAGARAAKDAVRAELRALRRERVPLRDRARDEEDLALSALQVAHEAGLSRGDWVAAYEALPREPPTEGLVRALTGRGLRVLLPVTLEGWDLDWREEGTDAQLGREAVARAGVVFLPAHAVDGAGTRLGRGRGCYDRALGRTPAVRVAVVHPWEVRADPLPREPHDAPVDAVIAAEVGVRRLRG
jgi:5-formyltetrahydrofolate cyclo-ligase